MIHLIESSGIKSVAAIHYVEADSAAIREETIVYTGSVVTFSLCVFHDVACHFLNEQSRKGGNSFVRVMLQTEVISSFALTDRVIHGPER